MSKLGRASARVEILLGEDPGDARGAQRVGLGVKRLPDGGRAGVPDTHVPRRQPCQPPGGRASSAQAEPGLRSGGTGTLRAFARWGTSRNRAVWYWAATLPRLVRQGDPAGAAHDDIGQSFASTRRKSSSLAPQIVSCVRFARLSVCTNP